MSDENKKRVVSRGATNKRKGSNAERHYATQFQKLGFDKCVTARYGSRIHDDAAIDLINIPLNVQIKAGKQKGLNPVSELIYMSDRIKEKFPSHAPEHKLPKVLIHRKECGRGVKRTQYDDMVYMSFEDFEKILKLVKWD